MLDHELINRTLSAAMSTGGEFAEVFVEDKRSSSAVFDDGRVEELTSGRARGAGIRVVVGDTTGFAHTADLTEAGLRSAAEAAAAAAAAQRQGRTPWRNRTVERKFGTQSLRCRFKWLSPRRPQGLV